MAAHGPLRMGQAGRHENRPRLYRPLQARPSDAGLDARPNVPDFQSRNPAALPSVWIEVGGGDVLPARNAERGSGQSAKQGLGSAAPAFLRKLRGRINAR